MLISGFYGGCCGCGDCGQFKHDAYLPQTKAKGKDKGKDDKGKGRDDKGAGKADFHGGKDDTGTSNADPHEGKGDKGKHTMYKGKDNHEGTDDTGTLARAAVKGYYGKDDFPPGRETAFWTLTKGKGKGYHLSTYTGEFSITGKRITNEWEDRFADVVQAEFEAMTSNVPGHATYKGGTDKTYKGKDDTGKGTAVADNWQDEHLQWRKAEFERQTKGKCKGEDDSNPWANFCGKGIVR